MQGEPRAAWEHTFGCPDEVLGGAQTLSSRLWVLGLGFWVRDLGFGVFGLGFRAWILGFGVWGLGLGGCLTTTARVVLRYSTGPGFHHLGFPPNPINPFFS